MRQAALWLVVVAALMCGGCNRAKSVSDFPLSASLTQDELEEKVGSPTKISNSTYWWAYTLKDGTELRLYFLTGPKGGTRTLTSAALFSANGTRLKDVFDLPKPAPATQPAALPTTLPTTVPVEPAVPTSQPATPAA